MTELMRLATVARMPNDVALKPMLAIYADDLTEYPADVLSEACVQWRRTQRFWPTISELIEIMEPRMRQHRRWMLRHAQREATQ